MYDRLRNAGAPYRVGFGDLTLLSNSRLALEASEYARDTGKFESFHEKMFQAYFTDARDIGDLNVVLDVAESAGLDRNGLHQSLAKGAYRTRLTELQEKGRQYKVTGTPTFFVNDIYKIVGAQSIDVFRKAFNEIAEKKINRQ